MLNETWSAGLFEGEGMISIRRKGTKQPVILCVRLVMSDREIVSAFNDRWPGQFRTWRKPTERWAETFVWERHGKLAAEFLRDIYPSLVSTRVKKKADLALEFVDAMRQGSRDSAYREGREGMRLRMVELNAKGPRGV